MRMHRAVPHLEEAVHERGEEEAGRHDHDLQRRHALAPLHRAPARVRGRAAKHLRLEPAARQHATLLRTTPHPWQLQQAFSTEDKCQLVTAGRMITMCQRGQRETCGIQCCSGRGGGPYLCLVTRAAGRLGGRVDEDVARDKSHLTVGSTALCGTHVVTGHTRPAPTSCMHWSPPTWCSSGTDGARKTVTLSGCWAALRRMTSSAMNVLPVPGWQVRCRARDAWRPKSEGGCSLQGGTRERPSAFAQNETENPTAQGGYALTQRQRVEIPLAMPRTCLHVHYDIGRLGQLNHLPLVRTQPKIRQGVCRHRCDVFRCTVLPVS